MNFNLETFNEKFTLVNKSNTSEKITYELPPCLENPEETENFSNYEPRTMTIDPKLLDKKFMQEGANYTDPYKKDFIDPNQDSENRMSLVLLINKFNKKFLGFIDRTQNNIVKIPGGKTKIVESFEHAAIRNFFKVTNLVVDQKHLCELLDGVNEQHIEICTYMTFIFKKNDKTLDNNLKWVPLNFLNRTNDPRWKPYYGLLYEKILGNLY